jgi:AcrR family transcriptional regulator
MEAITARLRVQDIGYMPRKTSKPLSGRMAQATRNDATILAAAAKVFIVDPQAPISSVAREAGVGISALYHRYRSKEALLRQLCFDGLDRYIAEAESALADERDPWTVYSSFMQRIVDADTHSIVLRLAGTFKPGKKLYDRAARAQELNVTVFDRARAAGVFRGDIEVVDIALIFEQLAAIRVADPARTRALRHRYLALVFDGLRARDAKPLPGPPPTWSEVNERWDAA